MHRRVWSDVRGAVPKPTLGATLRLLPVLLAFVVVSALASAASGSSFAAGLLVTLLTAILYAALWLLVSSRLRHRNTAWRDLVPGALVFGVGIEVLHLVTA